ncbi:MAG: restriction endonuclease subunit S [Nitrospira sp.]
MIDKLPINWEWIPLGEYVENHDAARVPVSSKEREKRQGKYPYYGASGVIDQIDGYTHQGEYLLLGEDGANLLARSKPIAFLANGKFWVNNHAHVLKCRGEAPNAYLAYYLNRIDLAPYVTGTAQPKLSQAKMNKIPIPVAPLDQQKRIVAEIEKQFSRLDEAVANLKRVKANLKRYKASVLKAAVEGKFASIDPSGWIRTNLGAVLTTIEAGKSFKCEERLPNIREIGVVKVSAVTWGTYDEEESKTCLDPDRIETRYFVKSGDFLFSRANTIQLVGRCVIAQKVTRKVMLSDKILRFHFSDTVAPLWVLYWLQSDIGRKEIERLSTGNQESMRNIGQERIRQIVFAFPGLEEQRAIVGEVERRLSVIEELQASVQANLTRAARLRQSVLQQAFSGRLSSENGCKQNSAAQSEQAHAC